MKHATNVFFSIAVVAVAMGTSAIAWATVPATDGKVTFDRYDVAADNAQCFTIDPDGTDEAAIGDGGCGDWSPNGTKILGVLLGSVGTFNPDGSGFTPLANLDPKLGCGFWSPDASRLLCNDDGGIYTVRSSDGGDAVQIVHTPAGYSDYPLDFSPDGSRVLFSRVSDDNPNSLFVVNSDGSGLIQLSPTGLSVSDLDFFDAVSAGWSPDGSQITFAAQWKSAPGRQLALYVVNDDGDDLRQISPSGVGALSAQWSPDGHLIAFSTKRLRGTPPPQVWVVHPDGTGLQEVTEGDSTSIAPVWSPDSSKLVFQRWERDGRALWTVNADGTELSKLATIPSDSESLYGWGTAPLS